MKSQRAIAPRAQRLLPWRPRLALAPRAGTWEHSPLRPVDGTQDAEASREAIGEALAEVLKQNPDADLQDLTDDQRLLAVQEYLARDMFHRLVLDVGGAIKTHAASARVYLKRLDQIRAYLRQGIAAAFRRLVAGGQQATRSRIADISRSAIADAIGVFEEYLK